MELVQDVFDLIKGCADRLPLLERVGYLSGTVACGLGMIELEISRPDMGVIHVVLGATTMLASRSTNKAREATCPDTASRE